MGIAPQPATSPQTTAPAPQPPQPSGTGGQRASFLQEDNGSYSSIRLMSMIALIAAIVFSLILLSPILYNLRSTGAPPTIPPDLLYNGMVIVFGFLLAAFAPKTLQKFAENKVDRQPTA